MSQEAKDYVARCAAITGMFVAIILAWDFGGWLTS